MTGHGSDTGQRPARNSDRPGRPEGRGRPDGRRHDRSGPSGKTDAPDHENEEEEVEEILEPPYTAPLLQGSGVKGGEVFSARAAAIHLLTLWEQSSSAPMESLLSEYLEYTGLADSDRRFLVELCYGSVRMRGTVRHLSNHFMDRDFTEAERTLRSAIAIGIYITD